MNAHAIAVTGSWLASFALAAAGFTHYHRPAPAGILFEDNGPGPAHAAGAADARGTRINIGEHFTRFAEIPEPVPSASWPAFRGPDRDNIVKNAPPLADAWPPEGPRVVWRRSLGEGYAAPVVHRGLVYILDYDEDENADSLRCFAFSDGRELWRRYYAMPLRRNHGKSRTVAAVTDAAVVAFGPMGHVMAADPLTGDLLWTRDLPAEFGSVIPQWYAGQCPLPDGDRVVLAPAGPEALLVALDARTGEERWRAPNDAGIAMSHASVMKYTLRGREQYVYAGLGGIAFVSAESGGEGRMLSVNLDWKAPVNAPSPVALDDRSIFLCSPYGYGGGRFVLDGNNVAALARSWKAIRGVSSEQQTPVVADGVLFCVLPKDAGADRQLLVACDVQTEDLAVRAKSDRDARFGLGPFLLADGKIYVLDDDGVLTMLRYEGNRFDRLGRAKILPGVDSWGPLAFADGFLLARDSTGMACVDLR